MPHSRLLLHLHMTLLHSGMHYLLLLPLILLFGSKACTALHRGFASDTANHLARPVIVTGHTCALFLAMQFRWLLLCNGVGWCAAGYGKGTELWRAIFATPAVLPCANCDPKGPGHPGGLRASRPHRPRKAPGSCLRPILEAD